MYVDISSLKDVILCYPLLVRSYNILDSLIELLVPENIEIDIEILFLLCSLAEIKVYPVLKSAILNVLPPVKSCYILG